MRRFGLLSVALLCATLLAAPMAAAQSINWTLGDVDFGVALGSEGRAAACPKPWTRPPAASSRSPSIPPSRCSRARTRSTRSRRTWPRSIAWQASTSPAKRRSLELMDLPLFVPWDYEFRVKVWDAVTPLYRDYPQEEVRHLPGRHPAGRAAHDLHQDRVQGPRRPQGQEDPQRRSDRDRVHPRAGHDAGVGRALRDLHRPAAGPARRQLGGRCAAFLQQGLRGHQVHLRCRQRRSRVLRDGQREGDRGVARRLEEGPDGRAARLRRGPAQGDPGRRHQRPADG